MCDPFTLIAGAAQVGGSLMGGIGGLMGGRQAAKAAKIQYAINKSNADLAVREGVFDAGRARSEASRVADAAKGVYAANGVDPSFGGAAWAQAWSASAGESDAQILTSRGVTRGAQYLQQGAAALAAGDDARRAGNLSFASSLLQTVGSFAKMKMPSLSPTVGAATTVETGDPFDTKWGTTLGAPNFWHR